MARRTIGRGGAGPLRSLPGWRKGKRMAGRNPVGVDFRGGLPTQGSRVAPTLGHGTQPLQGCPEWVRPSARGIRLAVPIGFGGWPRSAVVVRPIPVSPPHLRNSPTSKRLCPTAQGWSEATTLGPARPHFQPQRGCVSGSPGVRHPQAATPLGLISGGDRPPRVVALLQPWAMGHNPCRVVPNPRARFPERASPLPQPQRGCASQPKVGAMRPPWVPFVYLPL